MRDVSHGPARDPFVTRAFALAAIAGGLALVHSMVVPVTVSRAAPSDAEGPPTSLNLGDAGATESAGSDAVQPTDDGSTDDGGPEPAAAGLPPGYLDLEGGYAKWNEGAFFFDARREVEYLEGHIEGAIFMPSNRVFSPEGQEALAIVPLEAEVVLYCVGGDCDSSENAAIRLEQFGFPRENLLIMKAGYDDWVAAGYPTASGDGGMP